MKFFYLITLLLVFSCKSTNDSNDPQPSLEKATVVSYENMSAADFKAAIESADVVVLDVRTPEEIADGKIADAMELDFYDEEFADRLLSMDKSKDYYIYCKGGGRSAKTCRLMINNGFENVHNLEGGYSSWPKE